MVPKLFPAGKSFKGVALYITHDPEKAKTAERVDWTHTLNLAHDHIASAVDEMLWTFRAADMLKEQAGLGAGGRQLKNAAKHFSLNWHPSESPSREHMIETVKSFLKHMGWDEHQAILAGHKDKQPHVHVLVNAVHPETGRALDTSFEKRRASDWALQYERDHELIFCEQRLVPKEERTPSPTRASWEKLREVERQFDRAEAALANRAPDYFERANPEVWRAKEWDALRGFQRQQREGFFAGGKQAYREVRNTIFREVRTEFRDEWNGFYALRREGFDPDLLGGIKEGILERQNAELEKRGDAACAELRTDRDADYKSILLDHRMQRELLRNRQAEGLHTPQLLEIMHGVPRSLANELVPSGGDKRQLGERAFRDAADEVADRRVPSPSKDWKKQRHPKRRKVRFREHHKVRDPANAVGDLGLGAIGALADLAEKLMDGFLGGEQPRPRAHVVRKEEQEAREPQNDNAARGAEAGQRASEAREAEWLQRQWDDRKRRRARYRE